MIEEEIGNSGLSIDQQSPLLLGTGSGQVFVKYWLEQLKSKQSKWKKFFDDTDSLYLNVGSWVSAGIEGVIMGAKSSERGLIAPTTDIVSIEIISSVIGGLVVSSGKVIFKWIQSIEKTSIPYGISGLIKLDGNPNYMLALDTQNYSTPTNSGADSETDMEAVTTNLPIPKFK
ncbi:MAG: hypothetical protein Fur0023_14010 [Bacteroidia bacterium]